MRNLDKILLMGLLLFAFVVVCNAEDKAVRISQRELLEKAENAKELIRVKKSRGVDVAEAVDKAREARRAFKNGNFSEANRLLDEVIIFLGSSSDMEVKKPAQVSESEKEISLNLDLKKAYLVTIDSKYKKGKDISNIDDAIAIVPVDLQKGAISLKITSQPVFILEDKPILPLQMAKPSEQSPFGFHPAKVEDIKDPYQYALDIGVSWHRMKRYFIWPLVQRNIAKQAYDWTYYDDEIKEAQSQGLYLLPNIIAGPPLTEEGASKMKSAGIELKNYIRKNSYMPVNQKAYTDFVTACIERYDGDGIDDMPGLARPIKYWQIGNEPHPKVKDFAEFVKTTSVAIKKADPEAKVIMGGALLQEMQNTPIFDRHFLKILEDLNGKYIDIIDFHWGGDATGNYRGYKDVYNKHLRENLAKFGFPTDLPVWITEMSTYSGDPVKLSFQPWDPIPQTESQQASDLIKRYVYGLSLGIKKIFWAWGMIEGFKNNDSYFDHTGLIYDGKFSGDEGYGVKKLAYYSYQLMTTLLEGSDFSTVLTIMNGEDNIYAFKFIQKKSGKSIYVVWWDYFDEKATGKSSK